MQFLYICSYFATSLVLLFVIYPWSIYYENFTYGWLETILAYILIGGVVTLIGGFLSPKLCTLCFSNKRNCFIMKIILSYILFSCLALIFGPVGISFFNTRVGGIFFSEWKFITFLIYVALPLALLSGLL